jgi:hypothetical protein
MRFLNSFLSFLAICIAFTNYYAQDSNSVNYSLFLEKSVTFGTINTKIEEGYFNEGSSFLIPEADLTGEFSIYQDLYNALVGGRFGIEHGAIDNDIIMKIFIRNLNKDSGTYKNLGEKQDTLFSYFEIRIWELPDSNFYPEDSSYYFNEGYYAWFSLPKSTALLNFLDVTGIGSQDSLAFAFMEDVDKEEDDWNGYGIETFEDDDSVMFKAIHLSRIGGGRKTIDDNEFNPGIVNSIQLNQLDGIPNKLELEQNYPNPFNPSTKISYSIVTPGHVRLNIYNIIGKHVLTLVDENQNAGNYEVIFSDNMFDQNFASGIYLYTLQSNDQIRSKKMILMK